MGLPLRGSFYMDERDKRDRTARGGPAAGLGVVMRWRLFLEIPLISAHFRLFEQGVGVGSGGKWERIEPVLGAISTVLAGR